jgi:prevent-host-death family protein
MLNTTQQPKTVSASEAQNKFGTVVSWVLDNQREVVIESRGEPKVVIMSFGEYEETQQLKAQAKRREAFERLRALRKRIRTRNQDIVTEDQAIQVGDEITREAVKSLVTKEVIRFENK